MFGQMTNNSFSGPAGVANGYNANDPWQASQAAWTYGGQQGQALQKYLGTLQNNTAMHGIDAPIAYKQGVFNHVFPLMQSVYGNLQGQLGGNGSKPNASLIGPTHVTQGGVLNPEQIQQQVNQSRSQTDQATATQQQQQQNQIAGRGFGAGSPLAALLQQQSQAQGNATNASNETNIRLGAAQQNAGQNLQAQQAQGGINSAYNTAAVQNQTSHYNALIGLLGSFGNLM